jgi:hypothetical protein
MREERKPPEERQPDDYRRAADDSLELARVLAGQGRIGDQDFLERMARSDELADHDGETCGMCHNMILGAQVAREMLAAGEYEDVVGKWSAEPRRRWDPRPTSSAPETARSTGIRNGGSCRRAAGRFQSGPR